MKKTFAVLAALMAGQTALAADIYVREARGSGLSTSDADMVTDQVKNAVRGLPEHNLVFSEANADFVLQPTIVQNGQKQTLRLQALQGNEVIATNEQAISPAGGDQQFSVAAQSTLQNVPTQSQSPQDQSNSQIASNEQNSATAPLSSQSSSSSPGSWSGSSQSGQQSQYQPQDQTQSSQQAQSGDQTQPQIQPQSQPQSQYQPPGRRYQSQNNPNQGSRSQNQSSRSGATSSTTRGGGTTEANANEPSMAGGETRGMAPQGMRNGGNRIGYFSVGAGPAFAVGLDSDNILFGINGAYNVDFTDRFGGKLFGNLNFGSGNDASRFFNFGAGGNLYFPEARISVGRPYLTADVGWGSARRDNTEETRDALSVGAGAGFQFNAQQLNLDVLLHYSALTRQISGDTPQVLALQLAVNF